MYISLNPLLVLLLQLAISLSANYETTHWWNTQRSTGRFVLSGRLNFQAEDLKRVDRHRGLADEKKQTLRWRLTYSVCPSASSALFFRGQELSNDHELHVHVQRSWVITTIITRACFSYRTVTLVIMSSMIKIQASLIHMGRSHKAAFSTVASSNIVFNCQNYSVSTAEQSVTDRDLDTKKRGSVTQSATTLIRSSSIRKEQSAYAVLP
jgi:hypothetical protein